MPVDSASPMPPCLLALDWGTSSLRAFLMRDGQLVDSRASAHGIQHLPVPGVAGFKQALAAIAGDWKQQWPDLPMLACGMVGSAQGWREAPYVRCPADPARLAAESVRVDSGLGGELLITPGVLFDVESEAPDVMRGEETQIAGALLQHPEFAAASCLVMPGTHSKWVAIEQGRIIRFVSYLTGELFSVLKKHSILGRLMPEEGRGDEAAADAFEMGLSAARTSAPGDFAHQIFAARTLGLSGRLPPAALADYLSGVLIGHELCSGLAGIAAGLPAAPVLIGDPVLCRRYAQAMSFFGRPAALQLDNTAPAGLWQLARAAGLLNQGTPKSPWNCT